MRSCFVAAKTLTRWYGRLFNDRVQNLLATNASSRLHDTHLLLSFDGRKTAKRYTIPVNYRVTEKGSYVIGTEAPWQHNFATGADVEMLVRGQTLRGHGVVLDPEDPRRDPFGRALSGFTWRLFAGSLTIIEITPIEV